jgi:hypothetical protein
MERTLFVSLGFHAELEKPLMTSLKDDVTI